jgi:trimethylamine:corrinoid methyltransferase-like protein
MIHSNFFYLSSQERKILREKVFVLLESYGVKLDPHPRMFENLKNANMVIDKDNHIVKFPKSILQKIICFRMPR